MLLSIAHRISRLLGRPRYGVDNYALATAKPFVVAIYACWRSAQSRDRRPCEDPKRLSCLLAGAEENPENCLFTVSRRLTSRESALPQQRQTATVTEAVFAILIALPTPKSTGLIAKSS